MVARLLDGRRFHEVVVVFSNISRVVAILAMIIGIAEFALGFAIGSGVVGPYEQALARYSTASSSGVLINRGTYVFVFALALGTLAEISLAVRKRY